MAERKEGGGSKWSNYGFTQIFREDRRGAELDYLKLFGEAWLKAGGPSQLSSEFIREHPQYQALVQSKFGSRSGAVYFLMRED